MGDNLTLENIGGGEIDKRFKVGLIMTIIAVVLGAFLLIKNMSPAWGVLLFFPFLGSMLGFIQARRKICIALASQGKCNFDGGPRVIDDPDLVNRLKDKGNAMVYQAVGAALALTVAAIIVIRIF